MGARPRLSSDDRREHILAAATGMLATSGVTDISMERLARQCGVSKALIYAHFPKFSAVLDGVVQREFQSLEANGLALALSSAEPAVAAASSARIYFQRVSMQGSVLHMLLINPFAASQFSNTTRAIRNSLLRRMAVRVREGTGLSVHHSVTGAVLLTSIPERAGRMVFEKQVDMEIGAQLCELLTTTTFHALVPGGGAPEDP